MKSHIFHPRAQNDHADDWLMTYADMITLLLCFFAIFLSVSMPKKDLPKKVDPPLPVEQTLKLPNVLQGNLPFYGMPDTTQVSEEPNNLASEYVKDKPQPLPIAPRDETNRTDAKPAETLPQIVDQIKSQNLANIENIGDRVTTLQINSAAFFGSGSATLSDSGKQILKAVAENLKLEQFKGYQITVEGHTDDSPIGTVQFPSNWELSTARASAVVHYFLEQGISAKKLRAAGYADTYPMAPNRDANGKPIPDNQARNRRVVITLEKVDKTG